MVLELAGEREARGFLARAQFELKRQKLFPQNLFT